MNSQLLFLFFSYFFFLSSFIYGSHDFNTLSLFSLALGEKHVFTHFNNELHLYNAIAHTWNQIDKTIFHNNEKENNDNDIENNNNSKFSFVGCMIHSQHHFNLLKNDLHKIYNIGQSHFFSTYTSSNENIHCFVLQIPLITYQQLQQKNSREKYLITLLQPIPSVLKMELSILHTFRWLTSPVTTTTATATTREEQTVTNNHHALSDSIEENNINNDNDKGSSSSYHPIIRDIISGKDVELSIIIRNYSSIFSHFSSLSIQDSIELQKSISKQWINDAFGDNNINKDDNLQFMRRQDIQNSFYWTSNINKSNKKTKISINENEIDDRNNNKILENISLIFRRNVTIKHLFNPPSIYSNKRKYFNKQKNSYERRNNVKEYEYGDEDMWVKISTLLSTSSSYATTPSTTSTNTIENKNKSENYCHQYYNNLIIKYRRNNIIISIPKEMTHNYKNKNENENENENNYSSCLILLVIAITADPLVTRIALSRPTRTLNNYARGITQTGAQGHEPFTSSALTGLNQVVGVSDTGIDEHSCFFKDSVNGAVPRSTIENPTFYPLQRKIIQYINFSDSNGDYESGHGSHVSASIAGKCESTSDRNSIYKGMASDAKLSFFDMGVNDEDKTLSLPYDLASNLFPSSYAAGARIHSNSWGGGYWYDSLSIESDIYLYENPDFLILYAGGNEGDGGFYTVISPGMSKNAIGVAASETGHDHSQDINAIASFSSIGPAPDSRFKPDIVAPGLIINSALSNDENSDSDSCKVVGKGGTSMATPVAAGNAALIRQYFEDRTFWANFCDKSYPSCALGTFSPMGYLVKALLIHSGTPMKFYRGGNEVKKTTLDNTPDVFQGFGRVTLSNILPLVQYDSTERIFSLFVDQYQTLYSMTEIVYEVQIDDSLFPFKVSLSWFDPPNVEFSAKVLLHDLDLIVISPNGNIFYGNADSYSGRSPLGVNRDEYNTNEQVFIGAGNVAVGLWKVHVQAKLLTQTLTQNYSLVITTNGRVTSWGGYSTSDHLYLNPKSINDSSLSQCNEYGPQGTTFRNEVDVSLWSMVNSNGWDDADFYSIWSINTSSSSQSNHLLNHLTSDALLFRGYMHQQLPYAIDSLCVTSGCYLVHLNLTSTSTSTKSTNLGTQLSIPGCNIYLAPFHPMQSFCVSNNNDNTNKVNNIASGGVKCSTSCQEGSHITLPLLLYEYGGEGWGGSYYAIQKFSTNSHDEIENSFETTSVAAGSLEWDFAKIDHVCLPVPMILPSLSSSSSISPPPLEDVCFIMQLSVPFQSEFYPIISFLNAAQIPDNIYEVDDITVSTFDETMKRRFQEAKLKMLNENIHPLNLTNDDPFLQNICPYEMGDNVTFATICIHGDQQSGNVTFFSHKNVSLFHSYGQYPIPFSDLVNLTSSLLSSPFSSSNPYFDRIGACGFNLSSSIVKDTSAETNRPTLHPTILPLSSTPTSSPTTLETFAPSNLPTHSTSTLSPSQFPSLSPSQLPSLSPSQLFSTHSPSLTYKPSPLATSNPTVDIFDGHDFSCFSDCPEFPTNSDSFRSNIINTCDFFLRNIYYLCGTYSIAHGTCEIVKCAKDCLSDDWCYFGAGTSLTCPSSVDNWLGYEESYSTFQVTQGCLSVYPSGILMENQQAKSSPNNGILSNSNKKDSNNVTVNSKLSSAIIATIVVICLLVGLGLSFLIAYFIKRYFNSNRSDTRNRQLLSSIDSSHGDGDGDGDGRFNNGNDIGSDSSHNLNIEDEVSISLSPLHNNKQPKGYEILKN